MKKTVILYGNRNVCIYALTYLMAKGFVVKLISKDHWVLKVAESLGVDIVEFDEVESFDLFLCVHGATILKKNFLEKGVCVNVHPCLSLGYRGKDPIARYIKNKNEIATVDAHIMTEIVDEGEVVSSVKFATGQVAGYSEFYNQAVPFYFLTFNNILQKLKIYP